MTSSRAASSRLFTRTPSLNAPPFITEVEGERFITRGTVVLHGWLARGRAPGRSEKRKRREAADDDAEESGTPACQGERPAETRQAETLTKHTKAPPRYSESTLLGAMETAGKTIEDEELRLAMKDAGLGTPATRAAIIETLLNREYVMRDKKSLVATPKGLALVKILHARCSSRPS